MKILFLSRWFPYPPDNGAKIRIYNLIRSLSAGHTVTLIAFCEGDVPTTARTALSPFCTAVHTVPYRPFQPHGLPALAGFFSQYPRAVVDTYSPALAQCVRQVAATWNPELVIASQIDMAPYARLVPGARRLLDELELAVLAESTRAAKPSSRLRASLTWWKHARYVRNLLQHFDGCTVVSTHEYQLAKQLAPASLPIYVAPNGVELTHFAGDFGTPQPDSLIYTGALTYHANLDAMHYFVDDIFDHILAQRPATQLTITGATTGIPPARLPAHVQLGYSGYLPDIRPAVAQSAVAVVPLRIGGGTRLKILEALALGTPVVTTTKGIEGLELKDGDGVLIADRPAAFAASVVRLLAEPTARAALSAAGRQAVHRYDWARLGPALVAFAEATAGAMRKAA